MLPANEKLMDRIFLEGMGGVFISLWWLGKICSQGAPSPAKWKHLENFIENVEESISHHIPNMMSPEWSHAAAECSSDYDLLENQKNSAQLKSEVSV